MLVLTRKVGDVIIIAGNIRVTVVAVAGNKVRLGVEAPRDVLVDREEVHLVRQAGPREPSGDGWDGRDGQDGRDGRPDPGTG
jgi:carbon storage regulator